MTNCASESGTPVLRVSVANDLVALETARRDALDFVAPFGLSPRVLYKLELVLEETLTNRVKYAFPEGRRAHTDVELSVGPDAVVLRFEDDGVAFDPLQAPPQHRPTSLADAQVGGLGLALTRKVASACHYENVDGRNRFTVRLSRA